MGILQKPTPLRHHRGMLRAIPHPRRNLLDLQRKAAQSGPVHQLLVCQPALLMDSKVEESLLTVLICVQGQKSYKRKIRNEYHPR